MSRASNSYVQLCEHVASVEEGLSRGAQLEGHGYDSGHTVTERNSNDGAHGQQA